MAWLQAIAFLLGAVLLVYVIRKVGVQAIFVALARVGFGFFFVVAINGLRHVLRTIAMSISVPPEHRRFTFFQAFAARLGGESMSFLTFAGPLLGEATKVAMLRKRVPLVHGVPALVVDNLLYNLSVVLVVFGGACLMLFAYPVPPVAREVLIIIASVAFLGLIAAAMATRRRVTLLTKIIDGLARRGFRPRFLRTRRHHIYRVELTVYGFYKRRTAAFFSMIGLDLTSHVASVLEVYVTLKMLGLTANVSAAYIIESLTKVINFAFAFVPGTIGVYETGNGIILRTLGYHHRHRRRPGYRAQGRNRLLDRNRRCHYYLAHAAQHVGPRARPQPASTKTYGQSGAFKPRASSRAHCRQRCRHRPGRLTGGLHCRFGPRPFARARQARSQHRRANHGAARRVRSASAADRHFPYPSLTLPKSHVSKACAWPCPSARTLIRVTRALARA